MIRISLRSEREREAEAGRQAGCVDFISLSPVFNLAAHSNVKAGESQTQM